MSTEFVPPAQQVHGVPPENVRHGALLALATIPVGVTAWVVLWSFGFIASLVAALVAVMAVKLYVWGAGGLSRVGAVLVVAVTVVTLLLAFFGGVVLDAARAFGDISGLGAWGAFTHADFWPTFWDVMPAAVPDYLPDLAWAVGFGALGSFATLRGAFAATRPVPAPPAPAAEAPVSPEPV